MKRFEFTTEITAGITIHAENEQDARERIYYLLGDGQDFVLHSACTLFVKLIEEEKLILEDERDPFDESIEDKFATAGVAVTGGIDIHAKAHTIVTEATESLRKHSLPPLPSGKVYEPQIGPVNPTYIAGIGEVPRTPAIAGHKPELGEKLHGNPPGNLAEAIAQANDEDAPTTVELDGEERDLILAALRLWQATEGGWHRLSDEQRNDILMISTNDDEHGSLDDEAIDALCERINV